MQSMLELAGYATVAAALLYAFFGSARAYGEWRQSVRQGLEEQEFFRKRSKTILQAAIGHREREHHTWNGDRKFTVDKKFHESANKDICSFYLKPHDGKPIPPFEPGQFLTFRLRIKDQQKDVIRCYSLSDSPLHRAYYRVSIKRVPPPRDRDDVPPGLSSNYFHDHLNEGDILDVAAPNGKFYLKQDSMRPVVLIGGGIGLTPTLSMFNTLALAESKREVWFFYGVINSQDAAMTDHLRAIEKEHDNLHVVICYSNATEECRKGYDYDYEEHVSVDLFKRLLESNNYEFYICGPPPMMSAITSQLEDWGVPESDVHFEAFGPATVKKAPAASEEKAQAVGAKVTLASSGKTLEWTDDADSILQLASDNGVDIPFGCGAGNCGTCVTAIKSGKVSYLSEPASTPEEGTCLVCISAPDGDLVLDA